MNDFSDNPQPAFPRKRLTWWQRIGGGSLSIAILLHVAILLLGAFWVMQVIHQKPEKTVDFMPTGGGGGDASRERSEHKQRTPMSQNLSRVAAKDVAGALTLPEPDLSSQMSSLGALGGGGMSGGMGGSGSGGGRGDGHGRGFGSGTGPGLGAGSGLSNPFGMIDPNANALEGVFYDLKQTPNRKPSDLTDNDVRDVIREFTVHGWRERYLDKFYKAQQRLYQTKIYIPLMQAEGAPAAFNCEKEVEPKRWVVVYRGMVSPPKSGKYRFVGAGDDVLLVRFNNKLVFDHGFTLGATAIHLPGKALRVLKEEEEDDEMRKQLRRDHPVKLPVQFYEYDTTKNWNGALGGLAVGAEFEADAGKTYPIEILISEIPGGLFCASLLIEEIGQEYPKASNGSPIFPLFRLDSSLPEPAKADNAPPYVSDGPVWKRVPGRGKLGI